MKMGRRRLLRSLALAGAIATMGISGCVEEEVVKPTQTMPPRVEATSTPTPTAGPEKLEEVKYYIEHEIILRNEGPSIASKMVLRVALITTQDPYQTLVSTNIRPGGYRTIEDEYGNPFAEFEFMGVDVDEEVSAKITYHVAVNKLRYNLGSCEGQVPERFLEPEMWVESNAVEIVDLANQLTQDKRDTCQKATAIYNWIGDNIVYTGYCGEDRGALFALLNQGGDCTEFTDLMIALCRAAGIPARFLDGVTPPDPSVPTEKHNWAEVYLAGTGWVPMDPTWGRSKGKREQYFACMSPDHIIVSKGRNLTLLGGYHYFSYWRAEQKIEVSNVSSWDIQRELAPKREEEPEEWRNGIHILERLGEPVRNQLDKLEKWLKELEDIEEE